MDAYVFVRSADEKAIAALKRLAGSEDSRVRFATAISGPYDAFVAIDAPDLLAVQDTVYRDVRGTGATGTETSVAIPVPMIVAPKWGPPMAYEAFTQVRVQPGTASQVLQTLSQAEGVLGAAIVAGSYDILAELGAGTFDEMATLLLEWLHGISGIVSTQSYLAALGD